MNVRMILQTAVFTLLAAIHLANPNHAASLSTQASAGSILVEPTSGLQTTESGGIASFNIRLGSRPKSAVHINLRSSNLSEGTISSSEVVFGPGEWSIPQTIRITGVDDNRVDGNVQYLVIIDPAISNDPYYNGINPPDVNVTNLDNDVNQIPIAKDDSGITQEDLAVITNVLANDQGLGDTPLSLTVINSPTHGTANVLENRQISYTPQPNYNGMDTYRYQVCDRNNECSSANVALLVEPVNDPPVVYDYEYSTGQDTVLHVSVQQGVLAYDSDPEGDNLTAILVSKPSHGTLDFNPDGSFIYTPGPLYRGEDQFSYRASDGAAESNLAKVTIHVNLTNHAPQTMDDRYSNSPNQELTVGAPGVLANDSDPDGQALSAQLVTAPAHGTLILNPNGSFTYHPSADFTGTDTFIYRASDGSLSSNPASVSISVADSQLPSISWVLPTSNEQIYYAKSGVVPLQVNASDTTGIASVRFFRWDSIGLQYVDIGSSTTTPFQATVDISTLNMEWNEVFAIAYDTSGNASPRQFIWIFRNPGPAFSLFLPWLGR